MRQATLLFALMLATSATAAERCGTDDFGNTVCMDKDGVVATVPAGRAWNGDHGNAQPAASAGDSGSKDQRDGKNGRPRCGTDPFGNRVCR